MGHILYNELTKMIEPSLLCLQRCLQVSNSVTIILGGSCAFSDGALSYFNCTYILHFKSTQEVYFKLFNFSFKGFKLAMLTDKIGGENVEISHDGGGGKVCGGNPVPLESILQDGGGHGGPRYNCLHRRVPATGPVGQPLTAGPVEHPISGAISNTAPTGGAGGKLQGRTGLGGVSLGDPVGCQQGLGFIMTQLAGLLANLTGQGLPVLAGDAAGVGGNVAQLGSDATADLEAGHRIEGRR